MTEKLLLSDIIGEAKNIVVKVGSALVINRDYRPADRWLAALVSEIESFRNRGKNIVIVSSGAVAIGKKHLGLTGTLRLEQKQAASAVGQSILIDAWRRAFSPAGATLAQILITLDDTSDRKRYLNARTTLMNLLDLGAVPIVNENDTIATAEIRYGDNDRLSAHVAQLISADLLFLLSDVDGLYTSNPKADDGATHIPVVRKITQEHYGYAKGPNHAIGVGSGGMRSKIEAAEIAVNAGCTTIIADGTIDAPFSKTKEKGKFTIFPAMQNPESARLSWIRSRLKPKGVLKLDDGAVAALHSGGSLLAVGVLSASGTFRRGDPVDLIDADEFLIGKGLCTYDSKDLTEIAGMSQDQIFAEIGYQRRPAVVERKDMVLYAERRRYSD